jgi:hypothetical protein
MNNGFAINTVVSVFPLKALKTSSLASCVNYYKILEKTF